MCLCVRLYIHTYIPGTFHIFPYKFPLWNLFWPLCPRFHPQLPTFSTIRPGSWSSLGATISDLMKRQQKLSHQNAKGLPGKFSPTFTPFASGFPLCIITHSDVWSSGFLRCCQVADDPAILYFSSRASGGFAHHLQVPHAHIIAHQAQLVFQNLLRSQSPKLLGMQCWDAHRFGILSLSTKIHGCATRTRQWQHRGRIMRHPRQSCA